MLALFLGLAFAPCSARAGFFGDLFSKDATAGDVESLTSDSPTENSQTLSLLQANVSSFPILKEKDKKGSSSEVKKEKEADSEGASYNAPLNIISENALLATADASSILEEDENAPSLDQVSVYVVRKGDSLSIIAEMFDVSVNTILWANDLDKGSKIKEGDILLILPIDGVEHTVAKGETLKSIAQKYKAEIKDIADFNRLKIDAKLIAGDKLIIPDGEVYVDVPVSTKSNTKPTAPKTPTKNLAGYYSNPVLGYIKTQGTHGKNAVDLAAPIGTPVYAAADGIVKLARMGWNGAYGNLIIIQHPNGTETLYSHLYKIATQTGANVSQGELIGSVGNSGRVRTSKGGNGAHLHFEVHGARNPGIDRSWKD